MPNGFRRLLLRVTAVLVSALIGTLWAVSSLKFCEPVVNAQAGLAGTSRMVVGERSSYMDPIQVVVFKEGDDRIVRGVPFQAGDDWLKYLSVTVRNASKKNIAGIEAVMSLLDTGDGTSTRPIVTSNVLVGVRPGVQSGSTNEGMPPSSVLIEPGQSVTISFAANYDGFKTKVEAQQSISTIHRCRMSFSVFFADGTRWIVDQYYRPEPAHPGRYAPMSFEEFQKYSPSN